MCFTLNLAAYTVYLIKLQPLCFDEPYFATCDVQHSVVFQVFFNMCLINIFILPVIKRRFVRGYCLLSISPVARASSLSLSSSAGCWMFQDVRGSVFTSSMSRSRNMSIWLLLVKYLGMKQTLPLLKMSWRMSSVCTSSCMFRKTATRWLDRYLGCLNN